MNTTTQVYVVQVRNMDTEAPYRIVGAYSTKELADAAGEAACELWEEGRMHHTVHIFALDDMINGVHRSEL
jgi:hypothetical protein